MQQPPLPALALIDWGIGGLGVRLLLLRQRPDLGVTYVSDTGATPYGRLSATALDARLALLINTLRLRGVTRVFLACNAASTALARGARFALPTDGMITAGVEAVLKSGAGNVAVVGGERTVRSGVYRRALIAHGLQVSQRVAQPLSAAIEAGRARDDATVRLVKQIVAPLRHVEALLLACTHYAVVAQAFSHALPEVQLIDPAALAARRIAEANPRTFTDQDTVLTTGDPNSMRSAARAAWNLELPSIEQLVLR